MKGLFTALFSALLTLSVCAQMEYIPGDVLVQIEHGFDAEEVAEDLRSIDGVKTDMVVAEEVSAPMRIWKLQFDEQAFSQMAMLRHVRMHRAVRIAQNNHILQERITTPNDPNFGNQWHHVNPNDADIDSDLAWDITTGGYTTDGDTIVVCVIENSDLPHADLIDNAWFNTREIPNNGIDDDSNGYVDDYEGWNPGGNNDNVYGGSHGTQVCGMVGADGDNNLGVAGANWEVKIMVVTVGSLNESNVIASYTYPWEMRRLYNETGGDVGAFVVSTNASWGIDGGDPASAPLWCAVYDSLGTVGILSCGATANNNVNIDQVGDLPTACASDYMVAVTATNNQDNRTFSGYGATTIDVGAPGESVWTTSIGGGYGSTSGTSFASPLTAGVIGLLYSAPCQSMMNLVKSDPQAGADLIRNALFDGVDLVGNLGGQTVTGGRINSHNSLLEIINNCGACPTPYNLSVQALSSTDASFTWNVTSPGPYNVEYREVGTTPWIQQAGLTATNFTATGLMPCTDYEFRVETFCDSIWSGYSPAIILQAPVEPTPVISLSGSEVICSGDMVTLTSSASNNMWSTGDTTNSITVSTAGDYYLTAMGFCNNAFSDTVNVTVLTYPVDPTTQDVILPAPGTATLTATGNNILWYDQATGGSSIGQGSPWTTPMVNATTTFWCTDANTLGAPAFLDGNINRTTNGQYHQNANNYIIFDAYDAFRIKSVKVFADSDGNRPIALVDENTGNVVQSVNIFIPAGEQRITLDFDVPAAGQYGLRVQSGVPDLWRDGNGSNPAYPFTLGTLGEITGATTNNPTAFYYFFYEWEVQEIATLCESNRIPAIVDITVGINELTDGSSINVYPNPSDELINFDLSEIADRQGLQIAIYDATGRLVMDITANEAMNTISTAGLSNGSYRYALSRNGSMLTSGQFNTIH